MAPEYLTYTLIAIIVVGIAIGVLLVVLVADRLSAGGADPGRPWPKAGRPSPRQPAGAGGPRADASAQSGMAGAPQAALAVERAAPAGVFAVAGAGAPGADAADAGAPITAGAGAAITAETSAPSDAGDAAGAATDSTPDTVAPTGARVDANPPATAPVAAAAPATTVALLPEPPPRPFDRLVENPYIDPLTGLETLLAWERELSGESTRVARYCRPVSVVAMDLDGITDMTQRYGQEPARRVIPAVADMIGRSARRADRVAHIGAGRFLVLLPETDEIQAINFVERVRDLCEAWLVSADLDLRLVIGWASASRPGELESARRAAEVRMRADRVRGA